MKELILFGLLITGVLSFPTIIREGDMAMRVDKSLASQYTSNIWENGVIPYVIDTGAYTTSQLTTIREAMALFSSKVSNCITFTPRTTETNYISIRKISGCYSYVGNIRRGAQDVSLTNGCIYRGTIVHELMHAAGFLHEQNRPDRDSYVRIDFANVQDGLADQFEKYPNGLLYSTPYDYYSIMQYSETSFSKNGQRTIIPLQSGVTLIPSYDKTDAQILTNYDIAAVRARYQCTGATTPVVTTAAPVTTAPPATTAPSTTTSQTCGPDSSSCSYFTQYASTYCTTSITYTLNGVPFRQTCANLCGLCAVTQTTTPSVSCVDEWYCNQFSSNSDTYCATSGTTYTINGKPFRQACPITCNSCGQYSVALTASEPEVKILF